MSKIKESIIVLKYPNITFNPKVGTKKKDYITPKLFEQHLLWLLDWRYNPLSPEEFKHFLFSEFDIPFKSFMICFESGYKNIKQYAYPILKRYKIPALIFLVVNHIGDFDRWDEGKEPMLSIEDITELNKTTMITFGHQTKSNRILTKCTEEELDDEIIKGKILLEEVLRYPVEFFNYPKGKYDSSITAKVQEAEIPMAFINKTSQITTLEGFEEIPSIKLSQKDNYINFWRKLNKVEKS